MENISYKDTLNLPKTTFPMKANLHHLESNILCYWDNLDIYKRVREARAGKPKYVLHDGPPYANGLIHIGHALNKILKDIVVRYEFLKGNDCPFVVGWDCHGLPVEHQLFKQLNLTKHDVDIVDFRKQAREFALKYVELQKTDFRRLGIFSDWQNPYLTVNPEYEYGVMMLLRDLVKAGFVQRGRKPVNWCAECETALAEAEVEYHDKESYSLFCLFPVTQGNIHVPAGAYFMVWTTPPWTLVSNVAVAVHPELEYCLVDFNGKKTVLAKDLIPSVENKLKTALKIDAEFKGQRLEGITLAHPFLERKSTVVLADFVSKEDGCGCVHIAPGHGEEDFSLTKKYPLEIIMPVNEKGIFDSPEEFKGKNIESANTLAIEKLTAKNHLVKCDRMSHSYPHCWRCKKPVIFRATHQWFLKIDHNKLRETLLHSIEKVQWVPPAGLERMKAMLLTRPDWCLSRQRLWGIPIPSLQCTACGEVTLESEVIELAAAQFKNDSSNAWFTRDIKDFLPPDFKCPKCAGKEFKKCFDILDVWFESGASFYAVLKQNPDLKFPADLYLEGSDQHRGWFQVSLIPSVAIEHTPPFKKILTHGFVVDKEGKKMSKSSGNVISPQEIIEKHGAEILRLWTACSDYSEDVKISDEIIGQLVDMYRKIRNTLRFILGSIDDFDPEVNTPDYTHLFEVDKYMLSRTMEFARNTMEHYENFSFYKVCQEIFSFCNLDLSSFYLDILKDRLYTFSPNSVGRRSAQHTLFTVFEVLLKLCAPILAFTSEEAYFACKSMKPKKDSVLIDGFDSAIDFHLIDSDLMQRWAKIFKLREEVYKVLEKAREKQVVGSSLEAQVEITLNDEDYKFFVDRRDILREILIVSRINLLNGSFAVNITKAQGEKCTRCWNWREDTGVNGNFPGVCSRCADTLQDRKIKS